MLSEVARDAVPVGNSVAATTAVAKESQPVAAAWSPQLGPLMSGGRSLAMNNTPLPSSFLAGASYIIYWYKCTII